MATKTKPAVRPAVERPLSLTPAWTTEERVHRIETLGKRMDEYVQFMCKAGKLTTSSGEVKEKAIIAFYEQMVIVEAQLRRIHDNFQLE